MNTRETVKYLSIFIIVCVIAFIIYIVVTQKNKENNTGFEDEMAVKIEDSPPTLATSAQFPEFRHSKPNSSGKNVRFAEDEVKSSEGYGFKKPPPHEAVVEENPLFSSLPRTHTQTGLKYGYAKGKICTGKRTDFFMDFVLPECETYCDNGCSAFSYNERNGNCSIFEKCAELKDDENSITFVRVK